jgi:hypothetical protein
MIIRNTTGLFLVLPILLAAPACKNKEEKAHDEAAEAFSEAARQLAKASENLAVKRAADGVEKGAQGAEHAAAGMQNAAQAMKNWAKTMQGAGEAGGKPSEPAVEPVNFRDLKALLPETVAGYKRASTSGEKNGVAGMTISHASASYEAGDGKRLSIKLLDFGGASSPMAMAAMGFAMMEIDREDDNGYEKTTKRNGHKAYEKWNARNEHGEYKFLVSNRFLVEIDASKVPMETVKAAAEALDLGKLATLGK